MVFINGEFAAQRPNGYADFSVKADPYLRYGEAEHDPGPGPGARGLALVHRCRHLSRHEAHRRPTSCTSRSTACGSRRPTSTPSARSSRSRRRVENESARDPHGPRRRRGSSTPHGAVVASGSAPVTLLPGASEVARLRLFVRVAGAVERRRARPVHGRDHRDRRRPAARRGADQLRDPDAAARPAARAAHQRRDGRPARRLHPPRQRPARIGGDRARRGAPRRAPQGGGLQRDPQRAQPAQPGHARRLRPPRHARHGRDVRHVDRGQVRRSTTRSPSPSGGSATSRRWSRRTSTTRA